MSKKYILKIHRPSSVPASTSLLPITMHYGYVYTDPGWKRDVYLIIDADAASTTAKSQDLVRLSRCLRYHHITEVKTPTEETDHLIAKMFHYQSIHIRSCSEREIADLNKILQDCEDISDFM
jgi:hypothetical protein